MIELYDVGFILAGILLVIGFIASASSKTYDNLLVALFILAILSVGSAIAANLFFTQTPENNSAAESFCESMDLELNSYRYDLLAGFNLIQCYELNGFIETNYCFYDYPKQKGSEC